jgi:hypothetical protein
MKTNPIIPAAFCLLAAGAHAEPVWPNNVGMPMRHIMVSLEGNSLHAHADWADQRTVLERFPGQTYLGAASVLDGKAYGDQYGWLADGFIDPGAGNGISIELIGATAGLETYEGGMRMMKANHTYSPIFGTAGSSVVWDWPGSMVHNWYAAELNGDYEATYRVFVSDAGGNAVAGFTDATVTLYFRAVPAPGAAGLGVGLLALAVRRRRGVAS